MKKLKKLLIRNFELESSSEGTYILKGREPYIKSVCLYLRYNFLGLRTIGLAYKTTTPFDPVKDTIFDSISPELYGTGEEFLHIMVYKESTASRYLANRISEYTASLAQFSLFNPDTQETT